jgi:hypothetical protein
MFHLAGWPQSVRLPVGYFASATLATVASRLVWAVGYSANEAYLLANPHEFFSRLHMEWIGRHIPRTDARWMGQLLAQLSPSQVRDAFRSAGYTPQEVEGFSAVIQSRIAELNKL